LIGCGKSEPKPPPAPTPAPYEPQTVGAAWDNHFKAFGSKNVEQIALDYDDTSVVSTFNDKCTGANDTHINGYAEYVGAAAIKGFFTDLFATLKKDGNDLALELPKFTDTVTNPVVKEFPGANVFLVWKTTDPSVFPYATDSFFWKRQSAIPRIMKQNIVFTSPTAECPSFPKPDGPAAGPITKAWDNHFKAFGGQNTTQILEDYTESSVINVWDNTKATFTSHAGLAAVEAFFNGLWVELNAAKQGDDLGLNVPVLEIEPEEKSVFLVWESFSHPKATDSFYFDDEGKILVQNIVVATKQESNIAVTVV